MVHTITVSWVYQRTPYGHKRLGPPYTDPTGGTTPGVDQGPPQPNLKGESVNQGSGMQTPTRPLGYRV